ncbi:uncharacterized protein LOC113380445 [Ctenocephalides felis]|uniref:uncharacterized protein LOC113380445 n=1 Tax=Ctenocephalides felis TaxID=7515 RepID=UPI000E6E1210|nr:uncharacterized protein LOC113380445 [Ctenocephalides felis]
MDEIMKALKKIQLELDDQKKEIRNSVLKVTEQVTQNINRILEEKLLALEEKYVKLKEIVDNQEKRIYFLEKQARQRHNADLQVVRRLGKKGDKPRPTLISFSNLSTKINILKQKKALRDTCYYMKEDYPKQILEKRRQLQEQLKIERENGNMAFLKYDKLVIPKQTSKRKFSASPSKLTEEMSKGRITQTNKKNKPQHQEISLRRSNSITEGVNKPSMLNFLTKIQHRDKKLQKAMRSKQLLLSI